MHVPHVDTERSSQHSKASEGAFLGLILEGITGALHGWFDTARSSVERAFSDMLFRAAQKAIGLFLAFAGILFLLVGFSKILSFVFRMPGIGEVIVGCVIILFSLLLSLFTHKAK